MELKKALDYQQKQKHDPALDLFALILRSPVESHKGLTDYILYFQSVSQMEKKQWNPALQSLNEVLKMKLNRDLQRKAYFARGKVYFQLKNYPAARKDLVAAEKSYRGNLDYPAVLFTLGTVEQTLGLQYCVRLKNLYENFPTYDLVKNWSVDWSQEKFNEKTIACNFPLQAVNHRFLTLILLGLEEQADKEFKSYLPKLKNEKKSAALEFTISFLTQMHRWDEALAEVKKLEEAEALSAEMYQTVAFIFARKAQWLEADLALQKSYQLTSKQSQKNRLVFQRGLWALQRGAWDESYNHFTQLIKTSKVAFQRNDFLWWRGWVSYLQNHFPEAREDFENLKHSSNNPNLRMKLDYWLAKIDLKEGKIADAAIKLNLVASDPQKSYYALLAETHLKETGQTKQPEVAPIAEKRKVASYASFSIFADRPLASWDSDYQELSEIEEPIGQAQDEQEGLSEFARLRPEIENMNSEKLSLLIGKARILSQLGLVNETRWELSLLENQRNLDKMKIIDFYDKLGIYHRASSLAEDQTTQGSNNSIWKYAFPRAFDNYVMADSKKNNVKPEFVWGIMKAESRFNPLVTSPAGALGLMQILPKTGRRVSTEAFAYPDLLMPKKAIELGTKYIDRLSKKFSQSWPLMAAAYNAGPHRVHAWLIAFPNLSYDEWIEQIPFSETRTYVKRVIRNAWIYSNLYQLDKYDWNYLAQKIPVTGDAKLTLQEFWD